MSGTPPFQVSYSVQREDELPQELSKTFNAPKGEMTLQPSRSGRYIFNFIRLGDAHYQRIELQGPKIEQSIPEAAMAVFTSGTITPGSNKRLVDSCNAGIVGVGVELKVNYKLSTNHHLDLIGDLICRALRHGPWRSGLAVPAVLSWFDFPEFVPFRKALDIQIPEAVDMNGGTFEIDLGLSWIFVL